MSTRASIVQNRTSLVKKPEATKPEENNLKVKNPEVNITKANKPEVKDKEQRNVTVEKNKKAQEIQQLLLSNPLARHKRIVNKGILNSGDEKAKNEFIENKWKPFEAKLQRLEQEVERKTKEDYSPQARLLLQEQLSVLRNECLALTEEYRGTGRGGIASLIPFFYRMNQKAGITFYNYDSTIIPPNSDLTKLSAGNATGSEDTTTDRKVTAEIAKSNGVENNTDPLKPFPTLTSKDGYVSFLDGTPTAKPKQDAQIAEVMTRHVEEGGVWKLATTPINTSSPVNYLGYAEGQALKRRNILQKAIPRLKILLQKGKDDNYLLDYKRSNYDKDFFKNYNAKYGKDFENWEQQSKQVKNNLWRFSVLEPTARLQKTILNNMVNSIPSETGDNGDLIKALKKAAHPRALFGSVAKPVLEKLTKATDATEAKKIKDFVDARVLSDDETKMLREKLTDTKIIQELLDKKVLKEKELQLPAFKFLQRFGHPLSVENWPQLSQQDKDVLLSILEDGSMAKPIFDAFIKFIKKYPGEHFCNDAHFHMLVLNAGLKNGNIVWLDRSVTDNRSIIRYLPFAAWTRTIPYETIQAGKRIVLREAGSTEQSLLRINNGPYVDYHLLSMPGRGLAEGAELQDHPLYNRTISIDPGANKVTNESMDFEKIMRDAVALNPRCRKDQLLPGESFINVGQNSLSGSSIKLSQHLHISTGHLEQFAIYTKTPALKPTDNYSDSAAAMYAKIGSEIGAEVGIIQPGSSQDGYCLQLRTEDPTTPEFLQFLHDYKMTLLEKFGAEKLDFHCHVIPDGNGKFMVNLAPLLMLKRENNIISHPETGKTSDESDVPMQHIHVGNAQGRTFISPTTNPKHFDRMMNNGFGEIRRTWDFHTLKGAYEATMEFLQNRTGLYLEPTSVKFWD